MSLALIHDRLYIKTFWEKRINDESHFVEREEKRRNKSSLKKLRGEWQVRLETRNKHLKTLSDAYVRKVKTVETADQT